MSAKIYTNHHRYPILYGYQLPKHCRSQFDYLSDDDYLDNMFVHYRGNYYDLSEFMRLEHNPPAEFKGYDGYTSDSFFSGTLIKFDPDDSDYVYMATYIG